jgi:predicted ATP-grasp superfamily ATP-dependent carboligase
MAGVLLLGNLRCSLTLAREMAAAGHEMHCGVDELSPYLFASRAIGNAFQHANPVAEPQRALARIGAYLAAHPEVDTVMPISEMTTRLIVRNSAMFAGRARIAAVSEDVLETCVDKEGMFQLCERIGVPVAAREIAVDYASLAAAVQRIGRPSIVKPVDSAEFLFGQKAVLLSAQDRFETKLPAWPAEHRSLCVQRYVGGTRHAVNFGAYEGALLGAADCAVLHTDRTDGTGYTTGIMSVPAQPEIAEATMRLLRALNYTGIGDIDFIHDEATGELTFLELNPRVGASYKAASVAGVPLARWAVQIAHGERPRALNPLWLHANHGRVVWTKGAVSGLLRRRRAGELSRGAAFAEAMRIGADALRAHDMVFSWGDPAPALWDYLHPLLTRIGAHRAHVEPEQDLAALTPALHAA